MNRRGFLGSVAALCAMPAAVKATEDRAIELFNREAAKPFELKPARVSFNGLAVGDDLMGGQITSISYEVTCPPLSYYGDNLYPIPVAHFREAKATIEVAFPAP